MIALSATDRERLASGELARPEDALGEPEPTTPGADAPGADAPDATRPPDPADAAGAGGESRRGSSEDERILRELPPHFGRH